jgi:1,4-dihydroxy-2-naphthoate polyprenyltransferase
MIKNIKDIIIHLRFQFSLLLMPVFLLAISQSESRNYAHLFIIGLILHVLVYPSSNGFNSLMDDDKGSIGGVKFPPKVPSSMIYVTVIMDVLSLLITAMIFDLSIFLLLLSYVLASRAYSHRSIRLKKYPIIGFLVVTIFQGPVIYLITKLAMDDSFKLDLTQIMLMMISFLVIGAGYPLSQIYQHRQDEEDGVKTISMLLGIKGTFIFSGCLFFLQGLIIVYYFLMVKHDHFSLYLFLLCLAPVFVLFNQWMLKTFKDVSHADYDHTMKMNMLGSLCINIFFISITIKASYFE